MLLATGCFTLVYVLGTAAAVRLLPRGSWAWRGAVVALASVVALLAVTGLQVLWALGIAAASLATSGGAGVGAPWHPRTMARRIGTPGGTPERPATFFSGPEEFRRWLEEHHATATELWMGLNKKHVTPRGLTWAEAVEEALCFGWIDSQMQPVDADANRQRWTPRRRGSTWSRVNVDIVERLIADGRMTPAGIAAFERRREDRTAIYSYEQAQRGLLPEYDQRLRRARRPRPSGTPRPRPTARPAQRGCCPPSRRPPGRSGWPSSSTTAPTDAWSSR